MREELADALLFPLRLSLVSDVNLDEAVRSTPSVNGQKDPEGDSTPKR